MKLKVDVADILYVKCSFFLSQYANCKMYLLDELGAETFKNSRSRDSLMLMFICTLICPKGFQ